MKPARWLLILAVGLLCPGISLAQLERFELGRRLRAFDDAFGKHTAPAERKRAVVPLLQATTFFFSLRLHDAARSLDQARQALLSADKLPSERLWAESLYVRPTAQLIDTDTAQLSVSLRVFYQVEGALPKGATLLLLMTSAGCKSTLIREQKEIAILPLEMKFAVREARAGDEPLGWQIRVGEKVLASGSLTLSRAPNLNERLKALNQGLEKLPLQTTTDSASLRELVETLNYLASGQAPETNYPAARLLREAEQILQAITRGESFHGRKQPGEFWLRLVTDKGQVPVRMLAPESVTRGEPLPLVIALHGAGGSENLFFDAYGQGEIVKQCRQRGWLLVAPRASQFFGFSTPAAAVIDAVDKLYPVDRKRVFLVGHSMGAAQAMTAVQQAPERFAAVAALGGSGTVHRKSDLKHIPFFVGVGSSDFAVGGARKLHGTLKELAVEKVEFHEYPDVEHIAVVQHALPEVFAFFDRMGKKR